GAAAAGDQAACQAGASEVQSTLCTPRFAGSRHIIAFGWHAGRSEPDWVAKMPRTPGDASSIHHEMAALARLHGAGIDGVPRAAIAGSPNRPVLVQTFVRGQVLKPAVVRARPRESIEVPLRWLIELHQRTRRNVSRDAWTEAALRPLQTWLASG